MQDGHWSILDHSLPPAKEDETHLYRIEGMHFLDFTQLDISFQAMSVFDGGG